MTDQIALMYSLEQENQTLQAEVLQLNKELKLTQDNLERALEIRGDKQQKWELMEAELIAKQEEIRRLEKELIVLYRKLADIYTKTHAILLPPEIQEAAIRNANKTTEDFEEDNA
jgi:predicted RNase H-like nuclease (RuvC/YqgF family)